MAKKTKKNNLIPKMPEGGKINPFVVVIVVIVLWSIFSFAFGENILEGQRKEVPLNEVISLIKEEKVKKVTIEDQNLKVDLKSGDLLKSKKEPEISFYELLNQKGVDQSLVAEGIEAKEGFRWLELISNLIFPIITLGFLFWMFRSAGRSAGGIFSLGKSKAKLFGKNEQTVGFKDVAGIKEVKEELFEIVDFLKNSEKYLKLGARIPRGVLLIGPSGVGKTLLARAIAGEASVPFYSVAGSEFIEMIVGVGSARVRDLFNMAKQTSPSLIFIDEIDAIGRHRGRAMVGGNDEREQTLNQILVEMDGFDQRTNVIIIAATNRPDMLDPALIRPGRFDRHVKIDLPDVAEREEIIELHMKGKPFDEHVDKKILARQTSGFSGADIENTLNEAAIFAARREHDKISKKDVTDASSKVKLGPERRVMQSEEEKKVLAYHEAGHAIVGAFNPKSDPVNRVTIIARSISLGHTEYLPETTNNNYVKSKLEAMIQSALGGRAAELLIFNEETVGAAGDIDRVTNIARKMVTELGMSSLGPIKFVHSNEALYDSGQDKSVGYSEEIARKIDQEVDKIVRKQFAESTRILEENLDKLHIVAKKLLEVETIDQDQFYELIGKKLEPEEIKDTKIDFDQKD